MNGTSEVVAKKYPKAMYFCGSVFSFTNFSYYGMKLVLRQVEIILLQALLEVAHGGQAEGIRVEVERGGAELLERGVARAAGHIANLPAALFEQPPGVALGGGL